MGAVNRPDETSGHEPAELAALADDSLTPERRRELEAMVAESPELAERLAEQQRAVALMQNAASEIETPMSLRTSLAAPHAPRRGRLARGLAIVVPAVGAAVIVAAVLGVFSSSSSGQRFQVALASTTGSGGQATLTKTASGWRIELRAAGLPRLDNGRFYEAWLRNAGGVLVPIGTFNDGKKVTLWAGVSPEKFPLMTVTRERDDGNQASSGQKVLAGTVRSG
jgi:hypothetical protein